MNQYIKGIKVLAIRAKDRVVKAVTKPPPKKSFIKVRREIITTAPTKFTFPKPVSLVQALVDAGLVATFSQGRRVVYQHAVKINDDNIQDPAYMLGEGTYIIAYGTRKRVEIIVETDGNLYEAKYPEPNESDAEDEPTESDETKNSTSDDTKDYVEW